RGAGAGGGAGVSRADAESAGGGRGGGGVFAAAVAVAVAGRDDRNEVRRAAVRGAGLAFSADFAGGGARAGGQRVHDCGAGGDRKPVVGDGGGRDDRHAARLEC